MKRTIIFCQSIHHGNTKALVDVLAERFSADVVMLPSDNIPDLRDYELVGFASGIYMSNFGRPILKLAESIAGLENKKCFTIYTSGADNHKLDKSMHDILKKRNTDLIGWYNCRGFDTFGPFKLFGGIAKGHPDTADIEAVCRFYKKITT